MKLYKRINQAGVTLVEVMVVMGLLSVMLMLIATLFTSAIDTKLRSSSYSSLQSDGRFIMARLNYDIARASAIDTPLASGDSSSSLELIISGANYTYSLNNNDLQLTDPTSNGNLNSSGTMVSNLSFQKLGQTTVRYSFTLTSTSQAQGQSDSQTFTSTVGLRP